MHDVRVWVQEGETEKLVAEEAKARERLGHAVSSRGIKRYLKRECTPWRSYCFHSDVEAMSLWASIQGPDDNASATGRAQEGLKSPSRSWISSPSFHGYNPEWIYAGAGRAKACQLLLLFDENRENHSLRHIVDLTPPTWYQASYRARQAVWKSFHDRKIDECTAVGVLRVLMKTGICSHRRMLSSMLESLIHLRSPCVKLLELLVNNGATA